jgi:hypothetical protein
VLKLREEQRLAPLRSALEAPYRYDREVEDFLRRSAAVRGRAPDAAPGAAPAAGGLDALDPEEVVAVLDALDAGSLRALREHEAAHAARPRVLAAIDALLARPRADGPPAG